MATYAEVAHENGGHNENGCTIKVFAWFLRILKILSISALLITVACYMLIIRDVIKSDLSMLDRCLSILACVGYIAMCVVLIIGEIGPQWFLHRMSLFDSWAFRGVCLSWTGVHIIFSMDQFVNATYNTLPENARSIFRVVRLVVAWILIAVGLLYLISFLLCLRRICSVDNHDSDEDFLVDDIRNDQTNEPNGNHHISSSKENSEIISNMAMALNMTTKEARKRFKGKSGAKLAIKMRDTKEAQNKDICNETDSNNYASCTMYNQHSNSTCKDSPDNKSFDHNEEYEERKHNDDDDLEAAYYGYRKC